MASHVDLTMDQEAGALSCCRENPFFRLSLFLAALDSNSTLPVSPDPTVTLDSNCIIDRTSLNVDHYLVNLLSPFSISS